MFQAQSNDSYKAQSQPTLDNTEITFEEMIMNFQKSNRMNHLELDI